MRGDGGFTSGLLFANGKPKPGYAAYRLPLFLPVTSARRGRSLEVWGCVRPARYAILGAGAARDVGRRIADRAKRTAPDRADPVRARDRPRASRRSGR